MIEELIDVYPKNVLLRKGLLESFHYSAGAVEAVIVCNHGNGELKCSIFFDWIHSFRVTDEGDLLKMQHEQNSAMISGVYKVANSPYLAWFHEQSAGVYTEEIVEHYMLVTNNDVIDVLSSIEPRLNVVC